MLRARIALSTLLALAVGLASVACSSKPSEKIVGTWKIDLEATAAEDPRIKNMTDEERAKAMEAAETFLANMAFEFTGDGKAITKIGDQTLEGTYTVKHADGDSLQLETTVGEGEKVKTQLMKATVKGETLYLEQDGRMFVLEKT